MTKKEEIKEELKLKYFELINLVEEFKFTKAAATTKKEKKECQLEIDHLERRISGILVDVATINVEIANEETEGDKHE